LHPAFATRTQATYWFAGNAYLGRADRGESLSWLPAQAGHYALRAVDDSGASDIRDLDVEIVP
jgi:membrane carboxypeptidase/penicillin-binding protein PbpC